MSLQKNLSITKGISIDKSNTHNSNTKSDVVEIMKRECQDKFIPDLLACIPATGLNFMETSAILNNIQTLPFPVSQQTKAFNSTVKTMAKCLCTKSVQEHAILHDTTCSTTSFFGQFLSYICEYYYFYFSI